MLRKILEYNSPKRVMRRLEFFSDFCRKLIPILVVILLVIVIAQLSIVYSYVLTKLMH